MVKYLKKVLAVGASALMLSSFAVSANAAELSKTDIAPSTQSYDLSLSWFVPSVTNFRATSVKPNSVTLAWNKVSGAQQYEIYVQKGNNKYLYTRLNGNASSCTVTKYGSQNLKALTTYKFIIRASYKGLIYSNSTSWTEESRVNVKTTASNVDLWTTALNQMNGGYNYGCGGTSLTMIMNSEKGRNFSKEYVLQTMFRNGWYTGSVYNDFKTGYGKSGVTNLHLQKAARYFGYNATSYKYPTSNTTLISEIQSQLNNGHRLICGVNYSGINHYVVCYGMYKSGNTTYYRICDPYGGRKTVYTEATFLNYMRRVNMAGVNYLTWLK